MRCVVVGGVAVNLQGVPRFTADLGLAVAIDDGSLARAASVLTGLGLACRLPIDAGDLARPEVVRAWVEERNLQAITFADPRSPLREVDLVVASPVSFAELDRTADRVRAGGIELAVASIEALIRMKSGTGRKQERVDEKLRAYARLSAEEKLRWLQAAWQLTVDFLPESRREAWMRMRKGEL